MIPCWRAASISFAPKFDTPSARMRPSARNRSNASIVAPRGTSRPVIDKLNAAARNALAQDDTKKRYADVGMTITGAGGHSPEELDAYIKSEIAKWSKVIDDAHIQPMD